MRDFIRDIIVSGGDVQFIEGKDLPRETTEVFLRGPLSQALQRLNPELAGDEGRVDEVLFNLDQVVAKAEHSHHPVVANEEFCEWMLGNKSMPFGQNGEHTPVSLINFEGSDPSANQWIVSTEVTFTQGANTNRFDLVLWCNGLPVAVGECKSAVREGRSWLDGAQQLHDEYEVESSKFFVPNVFSFASDGKDLRYGSVGMPIEKWGPWRNDESEADYMPGLDKVASVVRVLLTPRVILEFLRFFTVFGTDRKHRKIKIIARFQQFEAATKMVERVVEGRVKSGLIWHFQGSGKSLLMVFTTRKLRATPKLKSPTVIIVVDRVDLDAQITATFLSADVKNMVPASSKQELQSLLAGGARRVIITTIHKFADIEQALDERDNIIVMVDEAHRTQEGDLGRSMRTALPNAFLFGLTGTPINKRDRNTFKWFGSEEDPSGYLSRYSFQDSQRDGATLPLNFEPRLSEMHLDEDAINTAFDELTQTSEISETDRAKLSQQASSLEVLIKAPNRISQVAADIAEHYKAHVEPQGFKAQVVVYDKETCVAYKRELDKYFPPEASTIVMSAAQTDPPEWNRWCPDRTELDRLLERFNDPDDPLKIIVVTAKLLTGFDAPILQAQYIDKPLKEHTLLQAITRTNRVYPPNKAYGLVVDYLGIFDDVASSLAFDDESVREVIKNLDKLKEEFRPAMQKALSFFPRVDRTHDGWEALQAAQEKLPDKQTREDFAKTYSTLHHLWEALSPDPFLGAYRKDYLWLSAVYQSTRPAETSDRLLWHALGGKTLQLIHDNVHVDLPRSDLETIVLNAELIEDLMSAGKGTVDPEELTKIVSARIAKHRGNPAFVELGKRLQELREKYANAQQHSLDFLKALLDLSRDTLQAEKEAGEVPREERGKAALSELFETVKSEETPIIVDKVVEEIDNVVRQVRFDGWQSTSEGDRVVSQELRKILYLKFKIKSAEVHFKALEYIREYY
ncbi:type I restriction endonuclease subunit R [Boudabousia liubingyangii]|uniref:type I restriction endonuclease subunit R n=1 Tax=Boudabousia liubingyangii TaxID=1921764 RepID=UPI001E2C283C|nr:type I restriction endonuclease subunit R [Boudabousia liubingyangii]